MKRTLITVSLLFALSGVAAAWNPPPPPDPDLKHLKKHPVTAPEINGASAAAAVTLLLGGLVVLRSRKASRSRS